MAIFTLTTLQRPSEFDEDYLKALLKEKSHQTSCELGKKINCDEKTILNHLHSMGFAEKLEVWVPHELCENNKENCLQIASQHLIAIEQHVVTKSTFFTKSSRDIRNDAYIQGVQYLALQLQITVFGK